MSFTDYRIWKYQLEITDEQSIEMPQDAKILSVQMQNGVLCLWALVDTERRTERTDIAIIGTDNRIYDDSVICSRFLGTVQDGQFVWHIFEL